MLIFVLLLLTMLLSSSFAFGETVPEEATKRRAFRFVPDVVSVQYAGNMGLASLGFGYQSKSEKSSAYFIYGYLPKSEHGVEVKTIAVKGLLATSQRHPFKGVTTSNYAGLNLIFARTTNTHVIWPDHYPDGYYPQNAIHLAPVVGGKLNFDVKGSKYIDKAGFFVEVGTLGYYFWDYVKTSNERVMRFSDIWNVSAGFTISLNKSGPIGGKEKRHGIL